MQNKREAEEKTFAERGSIMDSRVNRNKVFFRKKVKRSSVIVLCIVGVFMAVAAGFLLNDIVRPQNSVQVASAGNTAVLDATNQKTEPENTNPYGIDPNKPMIALTFDDGPSKHTWSIVDTLSQHQARATFFLLGSRVDTHQSAIDNVLANHNEIASHSYSHKNMTKLSEQEIIDQIRPVDAAMQEQHDYTPALFRVPYGAKNETVEAILKAEGKPIIGWSVDPYDWKVKNKDKIVNHILNSVQDGDIVLMHDIYEPTAEAVAELVPLLQERGFQLVTVSELFQFRGVTPESGQYYRSVPPQKAA